MHQKRASLIGATRLFVTRERAAPPSPHLATSRSGGKKEEKPRGPFAVRAVRGRDTLSKRNRKIPFAGNKVLMVATSTLILPKVVNEISKTSCFSSFRIRPYVRLGKSIRTSIYILATHYDSRSTERLSIFTRAVFTLICLFLNLSGEIPR